MSLQTHRVSTPTAWLTTIFAVAILVGGCASPRMAQVDPSNAATVLEKGDKVEITRKGGEYVPLKVTEVTSTEVIGDDVRVPIDDIAAITKFVRGPSPHRVSSHTESEAEYLWGWVGAVVLLALIL